MHIYSYSPLGYDGQFVEVECDISRGLPCFSIVGLPGSAVREARERVRAALRASGLDFPQSHITISLSPGDTPKIGSGFDLAIAMALLHASRQLVPTLPGHSKLLIVGELGLKGQVRRAEADALSLLHPGAENFDKIIVPAELKPLEGILSPKGKPLYFSRLGEVVASFTGSGPGEESRACSVENAAVPEIGQRLPELDSTLFSPQVLESLILSAAGCHNILLYGPPGSGKTSAARFISAFYPVADRELRRQQLRIHLRSGPGREEAVGEYLKPFREPHHSASAQGMLGGGKMLAPGEISLSHGGVLLMDEAPEFHRNVLQALREPMEQGWICVVRADRSSKFPCKGVFAFTMNLCACGNRGRTDALCMCSSGQIQNYWSRLGGALYDRIEIRRYMSAGIAAAGQGTRSDNGVAGGDMDYLRNKVDQARAQQKKRGHGYNSYASWGALRASMKFSSPAQRLFDEVHGSKRPTGRQLLNLCRLAATAQDLLHPGDFAVSAEAAKIALNHMFPGNYDEYL